MHNNKTLLKGQLINIVIFIHVYICLISLAPECQEMCVVITQTLNENILLRGNFLCAVVTLSCQLK